MMQDIFIKSVVQGFSPANRCSPKGLRYPPASPEAKPMAGRHSLDANNYMLWVIDGGRL